MPAPDQTAFGKPAKKSDSRTVLLSLALSGGLLTGERAPTDPVHNELLVTRAWGDLGNKQRKDCAIAAAGHAEMLWAAKYRSRGYHDQAGTHPDPPSGTATRARRAVPAASWTRA